MKTLQKVLLAGIILFAFACKKKEVPGKTVSETLSAGSWKINFYQVSTVDHTSEFNGYTLVFKTDNTLNATNGSGTTAGTWSYDSNLLKFNITIGSSTPLTNLSKDWLIVLMNDDEVIFDQDSTVSVEELHIKKI